MMEHLDPVQKNRVFELTQKIQQLQMGNVAPSPSNSSAAASSNGSQKKKSKKGGAASTVSGSSRNLTLTASSASTSDLDKEQINNIVESKLDKLKVCLNSLVAGANVVQKLILYVCVGRVR
jgi:hypothetical protein